VRDLRLVGRRIVDVGVAASVLFCLLPLLCALTVLVSTTSRGPAFFVHTRMARGGGRFGCIKFRTMYHDADQRLRELLANDAEFRRQWMSHHKVEHDPRITRVGRLLRRWSLDELPQLVNILKGDMSFIGPRPVPTYEIDPFGEALPKVLSVPPGLTGLWQVSGRSELSVDDRIRLDLEYVDNRSVVLDLRILGKTAGVVLAGSGAY
jgi:exopolysaccharide production protein ExoY